jgi:hypothetical protein
MKLPRRQFLHLAVGAAALPAVSRIARAQGAWLIWNAMVKRLHPAVIPDSAAGQARGGRLCVVTCQIRTARDSSVRRRAERGTLGPHLSRHQSLGPGSKAN